MFWRVSRLRPRGPLLTVPAVFLAAGWLAFSYAAQAHCGFDGPRAVTESKVAVEHAVSRDVGADFSADHCQLPALRPDDLLVTSFAGGSHFSRQFTLATLFTTRPETPPPRLDASYRIRG